MEEGKLRGLVEVLYIRSEGMVIFGFVSFVLAVFVAQGVSETLVRFEEDEV